MLSSTTPPPMVSVKRRRLDTATVDKFDLKFERLDDADGALSKEPDWPFLDTRAQPNPNGVAEDQGTVTGAERFSARLADAGIYKYTVTAYRGVNQYVLDPAIIIGK